MSLRDLIHGERLERQVDRKRWSIDQKFHSVIDAIKRCINKIRFPFNLKKLKRGSSKSNLKKKNKTLQELLGSKSESALNYFFTRKSI